MSRVQNAAASKEKIDVSVQKLKSKRSELIDLFNQFYAKQERTYQPISLKDFYLFNLNRQFNQLLNSFDIALNKAVLLSEECDQCDDSLGQFVSYKATCSALLSDMTYLLQSKPNDDMARQYLFFVNELCVFEEKLKDKEQLSQPHAYENAMRLFRKAYDKYEIYFNRHSVLPETREIRSYVEQTQYPGIAINDPGHIEFLLFCMSISANKLQEKMRVAHNACNQAHQTVLKSLEPKKQVDSDDDYVLDCSV